MFPLFADFKIRQRHDLLAKTIGVKKQEEDSLANSNTLMITVTVCMIVFSVLEVALYLLYNRMVSFSNLHISFYIILILIIHVKFHPWRKIITGELVTEQVKEEEEEHGCMGKCCTILKM